MTTAAPPTETARTERAFCGALALLTLALTAHPAAAAPLATTAVACSASTTVVEEDVDVLGPLPLGLFVSCDRTGIDYRATSDVQTDFGPGLPRVGAVVASASTSTATGGPGGLTAFASSGGSVLYHFEIMEEVLPPFAPVMFPFYFEARGEGTLSGVSDPPNFESASAMFTVRAGLLGTNVSFGLTDVDSSETSFDSFDENTLVDLPPNSASNPFYSVEVLASCQTTASGTSASCQAVVDPLVRFDQASFDATHGSNSFELAAYYRLAFSENLPVPEPAMPAPVALAVLGTLAAARRRRDAISRRSRSRLR